MVYRRRRKTHRRSRFRDGDHENVLRPGEILRSVHIDDNGVMVNATLRTYRIPTFADVPRTKVILVDSSDSVGPMRAKGIAECCINPIAPALYDANGVRYRELPLTPERIYDRVRSATLIPAAT
jgi:putative selenate reductase molybdopterin-binding subunit